jgi:hypothetical protein
VKTTGVIVVAIAAVGNAVIAIPIVAVAHDLATGVVLNVVEIAGHAGDLRPKAAIKIARGPVGPARVIVSARVLAIESAHANLDLKIAQLAVSSVIGSVATKVIIRLAALRMISGAGSRSRMNRMTMLVTITEGMTTTGRIMATLKSSTRTRRIANPWVWPAPAAAAMARTVGPAPTVVIAEMGIKNI